MSTPGSNQAFPDTPPSSAEAVARTRAGLPTREAQELAQALELDHAGLARLLGISPRTLDRRLGEASRLEPTESDRLARAFRVLRRADDVFDNDTNKMRGWFKAPNRALGGESPRNFLDTDAGVEAIMAVLDRIDYGLYA